MREIEFRQLKPGEVIFNTEYRDEPWTVVAPFKRYDTFLIVKGREEVSERTARLWLILTILPDRLILDLAEHMNLRVRRIFNPQKWEKETNELSA